MAIAALAPMIGLLSSVASAAVGVMSAQAQAQAENNKAQYEKQLYDKEANYKEAVGQREAVAAQDQGKNMRAKQVALLAASGGGGFQDAGTGQQLLAHTTAAADFNAKMDLASSQTAGDQARDQGNAGVVGAKADGDNRVTGSILSGIGDVASGFGKFAGGMGGGMGGGGSASTSWGG